MKPIVVILNPKARSERAQSLLDEVVRLSTRAVVRVTEQAGGAWLMAQQAVNEGFETIVAAGGDGTINEVVNGLAGTNATLGLLPLGTMNVFSNELGVPANNLKKCWEIIEAGHTRGIDLGKANDRYFVQLAGVGLDAQVVEETTWELKKSIGPLSYLVNAAQIAARKPPQLTIESEGRRSTGSFVLIGNGRYYGGPFTIFKQARIDDGLLDVLVVKNLGYLDIVRYLQAVIFGNHTKLADVEYFQTPGVIVRSGQEVPVEVDGEVIGRVPVTFRVSSKKLKVLVPPARH